jgi:hypothetical protein
VMVMS